MMKKWILGLILLYGVVFCQAQDSTFLHDYKIFYYPNGVKSSEGRIVAGKPDGWWKSYNEKGILVSEGNRKNFLLDSLWTFYNDDASLRMTVHYKEDLKDGVMNIKSLLTKINKLRLLTNK